MQEICRLLRKHRYKVKQAAKVRVCEEVVGTDAIFQICAAKETGGELELAVDADKSLVIVQSMDVPEEKLVESLKDLNRVSQDLDSDTVLVPAEHGEFSHWQEQGYTKEYQCILTGDQDSLEMEKVEEVLEQAAAEIAVHLEEDVQIFELASDLPYIYSIDLVEASAESPLQADYHCHLNYHELTGAVYLNQLWIPEEKRRQGIGSATVDILKQSLSEAGANYLYLKATGDSEPFWDGRADFDSFYRLNQRWARRMRHQLRREPGWDRVFVQGVQLEHKIDYYGNHPGEDWDFFQAQQLLRQLT